MFIICSSVAITFMDIWADISNICAMILDLDLDGSTYWVIL